MKQLFAFVLIIILSFGNLTAYAQNCPLDRPDLFCISKDQNNNKEMTLTNFYTIPINIFALYRNEIEQLAYPLSLNAEWESPYFGAGISLYENSYRLMILGGMARMKEMTLDGYAAIICHELGHIFGGEPRQTIQSAEWSSSEGQADFFAASKCLPKYFKSLGINDSVELSKKIEKAGFDFINLATVVETIPENRILRRAQVILPDVKETLVNLYPSTQCRYETYRNPTKRANCWFYK